jgi:hypothetical protein
MTSDEASPQDDALAESKSALQDNIARKGKNAYYFAHAHKANGPVWDGKTEPKLLSRQASEQEHKTTSAAFDYNRSNITM